MSLIFSQTTRQMMMMVTLQSMDSYYDMNFSYIFNITTTKIFVFKGMCHNISHKENYFNEFH